MTEKGGKPPLAFVYQNIRGEVKEHTLQRWAEVGRYIRARSEDGTPLTFRIDRVVSFLNGCDAFLQNPVQEPPPKVEPRKPRDQRPQVLFTGFGKALRDELEAASDQAGLNVMKSVTQQLSYLCCGPNAGPIKMEKSRAQGVFILDETQLRALLESGELPDEHDRIG